LKLIIRIHLFSHGFTNKQNIFSIITPSTILRGKKNNLKREKMSQPQNKMLAIVSKTILGSLTRVECRKSRNNGSIEELNIFSRDREEMISPSRVLGSKKLHQGE